MNIFKHKLFKQDYLKMVLKNNFPFLRQGKATIRGHCMWYPHWDYFWGIFYEIGIDGNYRIDGLENVKNIIDAGANIGVSAVYFAQTYPEAHIECFEPNPESVQYLRENVASYASVKVHPYAVGSAEKKISFFVDAEIPGSSIASTVNLLDSKRRPKKEIEVEMKKMSDYIHAPVDILKIDIEGGEMDVIEELISSGKIMQIKNILMEFHYDPRTLTQSLSKMLTLLEGQGFFVYVRRGAPVLVPKRFAHAYMLFAFRK